MENQALDFVISETGFKSTPGVEKAVEMFLNGKNISEVCFEPSVWNEKSLGFWVSDKIESSVKRYLAFKEKQSKYISDLNSRGQSFDEEVIKSLQNCSSLIELDEFFRPYKKKKKTKATLAREAGLLEFADKVLDLAKKGEVFEQGIETEAKKYINPSLGYITFETVIKGIQDIFVERAMATHGIRKRLLDYAQKSAEVVVKAGEKFTEGCKYSNFVSTKNQRVDFYLNPKNYDKFPSVRKGWEEGFLRVSLEADWSPILAEFETALLSGGVKGDLVDLVKQAAKKALEIHAIPSITTEIFDSFFFASSQIYIQKLKSDYFSLLSTPAFGDKPVLTLLGREKGSSSLVFVSHSGDFVSSTEIDLSEDGVIEALKTILSDVCKNVSLGAVGIGLNKSTRRAEKFIRKALEELEQSEVPTVIVDPRGINRRVQAEDVKRNVPQGTSQDAKMAFLLGKRLQNPLYEYAAHDPVSLVEVPQFLSKEVLATELKKCLSFQIASFGLSSDSVNHSLLSNLGWFEDERLQDLSSKLVSNPLEERKDLRDILSEEEFTSFGQFFVFTQALSLLDRSRVPLSKYSQIKDLFKESEVSLLKGPIVDLKSKVDLSKAESLIGGDFFQYISSEFENPFKDTRKTYKVFSFSKGAESIEELQEGNLYWGIVTKFSSFGAFVDIGVGVDGLIHLSELSTEFISDPRKVLRLGQWVLIKALKVDQGKRQLSLSKIQAESKSENASGKRQRTFNKNSDSRKKVNAKAKNFKGDKPRNNRKGPGNRSSKAGGNKKPQQPFNNPFAALGELKK